MMFLLFANFNPMFAKFKYGCYERKATGASEVCFRKKLEK
jgi:hypothetical protein